MKKVLSGFCALSLMSSLALAQNQKAQSKDEHPSTAAGHKTGEHGEHGGMHHGDMQHGDMHHGDMHSGHGTEKKQAKKKKRKAQGSATDESATTTPPSAQ